MKQMSNRFGSTLMIKGPATDPVLTKDEVILQIKGGSPMIVNVPNFLELLSDEAAIDLGLTIPKAVEAPLNEFKGSMIVAQSVRGKEFDDFLIRSSEKGLWMSVNPVDNYYLHGTKHITGWKPAKVVVEE